MSTATIAPVMASNPVANTSASRSKSAAVVRRCPSTRMPRSTVTPEPTRNPAFGRTPTAEGTNGREHHPFGFSMWLAGGGVKGGYVYGKTDKEGATVVERPTNAQDYLATVCELMGIDHTKKNETATGRPVQLDIAPEEVPGLIDELPAGR